MIELDLCAIVQEDQALYEKSKRYYCLFRLEKLNDKLYWVHKCTINFPEPLRKIEKSLYNEEYLQFVKKRYPNIHIFLQKDNVEDYFEFKESDIDQLLNADDYI